ncbi:hypothetical protein GQ457_09G024670 [Hibiscus cannabinus]
MIFLKSFLAAFDLLVSAMPDDSSSQNVDSGDSSNGRIFTNKMINIVLDETIFLLWKQQVLLTVRSHRLERLLTGDLVVPPEKALVSVRKSSYRYGFKNIAVVHYLRSSHRASGHTRASVSSGADKWVVDSGATHHATPDASKVVNGADYNGLCKLVVGNGHSLDIYKTDHAVIPTKYRALVINDLLHVPSITKNLISVSKFARDNDVYFEFHAKHCLVKDGGTGEVLLQGQESNGLYQFAGLKEVNNDSVMSPNTPSFTMNGENECEGQLSAGDQDNGGRQENDTDVGGINDGIQLGATIVGLEVSRVSPEIPRAESGVEAAVEQDVQSGDESICGDMLLSGVSDEAVAGVPEINVTNLPVSVQTPGSSRNRNRAFGYAS